MSLYIKFPRHLLPGKTDLIVLGPGADPNTENPSRIVVGLANHPLVGRADDEARGLTVFVSGRLTNLPGSLPGGGGAAAARALANLYAKDRTQALSRVDGAFSFAILDWRRASIVVGRDKLGIGRAYLSRGSNTVAFSDCLSDLLRVAPSNPELDLDSIYA